MYSLANPEARTSTNEQRQASTVLCFVVLKLSQTLGLVKAMRHVPVLFSHPLLQDGKSVGERTKSYDTEADRVVV